MTVRNLSPGRRRRRRRRPRRGLLGRYLVGEIAAPTALGFVTYTFLLMLRAVFSLAEQVFVSGLRLSEAGALLLLALPHVVVLTIPMALLFGVLLGLGRLNADNELVAMQAAGIPLGRLVRPVLALAGLLFALNVVLTVWVLPASNQRLRALRAELLRSGRFAGHVEPKVFYDQFPGLLLYVRDVDRESGYWRGVVLYDRSVPGEERLVIARRGRLVASPVERGERPGPTGAPTPEDEGGTWLLLEGAVTHHFDPGRPESYRRERNEVQLHRLGVRGGGIVTIQFGAREQSTGRLLETVRRGPPPTPPAGTGEGRTGAAAAALRRYRDAAVELNKRLAIPGACLAFALIGIPLGVGARSSARGRGFVLSLLVILAYYVLLNHGELLAREGRAPAALAIWAPNLVLAALALPMLWRMGRWLGERRRGGGVALAWRRWRGARRGEAGARDREPTTGSIPVGLQRRRWGARRFPLLLDRYVTRRLVGPLVAVLVSTVALYMVVDLADKIDEISKHTASLGVFLAYYWNVVPQVILDTAPLAVLIAVLVVLVVLERSNELTSLKAAGISVYRVAVPIVVVAALVAGGLFVLEESVAPGANRKARRYLDVIKGRETSRRYAAADRQWVFSRDGRQLYNFLRYDAERRELVRLTVYRFGPAGDLVSVVYADRVRYADGSWIASAGWVRRMLPDGTDEFHRIRSPVEIGILESPRYFAQERRSPGELTLMQLRRYIETLRESGYRPTQLMVRWHQKITYPLSAFVMVLLGLPFGLARTGRRASPMVGVALGIGLGIGYFLLVAILGKMGEADVLPPAMGAWTPPLLAVLFAVNRLTTVRS